MLMSPNSPPPRPVAKRAPPPASVSSGVGVENATEAARIQLDAVVSKLEAAQREFEAERERADKLHDALVDESEARKLLEQDKNAHDDAILRTCEMLAQRDPGAEDLLAGVPEGRELPQYLLKLAKRSAVREAQNARLVADLEDQLAASQARIRELERAKASPKPSRAPSPPSPPPPPPPLAAAAQRDEWTHDLRSVLREERQVLVDEVRKLGSLLGSSVSMGSSTSLPPPPTAQPVRRPAAREARRLDSLEGRIDQLQHAIDAALTTSPARRAPRVRVDRQAEELLMMGEQLFAEWDRTRALLERVSARR